MCAAMAFAISLFTLPARAEPVLVVLVRPPAQSAIVSEAITRIRGELVADGFDVMVVEGSVEGDEARVLPRAEPSASAAVTVGMFVRADAKTAEVWVVDRVTNKTVARTIDLTATPAGVLPEVLARRSVELLRASLLEALVETAEPPSLKPAPRDEASRWAERALDRGHSRFGIEAGAQVLGGSGEVGSAWMPVARARFGFVPRLAARLTLSGLGTRPSVEFEHGSASVNQALGLLELVGEITSPGWLTPFVSLGAGVYHAAVDGSATFPYEGTSAQSFSFAADTGVGLSLSIAPAFAVSLEGHAMLVTPYPVVRFAGEPAVELDNPRFSGVLTLTGWL